MIDEGYIKFELEWLDGPPPDAGTVAAIERWRRPLYDAKLVGHYADLGVGYGNLSLRSHGAGHFVITGTQTGRLPDLAPEHYTLVDDYDIDANRVTCRGPIRASSESMTHAALYELSSSIEAVVHVHSALLWQRLRNRLPTTAADIAYGTPDMAREFRRLYRDTAFGVDGIAVMGGHEEGIVAIGPDIGRAARRILALGEVERLG